jgi:hypothetical protein
VTYLVAATFFILALLGATVTIHMMVRTYWTEILLALKGELGAAPRAPAAARPSPAYATTRQHAVF